MVCLTHISLRDGFPLRYKTPCSVVRNAAKVTNTIRGLGLVWGTLTGARFWADIG